MASNIQQTTGHTRMTVSANVRLKSIALPVQHGGWGFVSEPVVLGLLVAPSVAGVLIGIAAFGAFLMHQPLKLTVKDYLKRKRYARTVWAERFALLYGGIALAAFVLALTFTPHPFVLPLLLAIPFAAVQVWADTHNQGRETLSEVSGAVAFGAVASAIALSHGWELVPALALWGALAARSVTSVLYVRARLRLEYGKPAPLVGVAVAHGLGAVALAGLIVAGTLHGLSLVAFALLTVRAALGLSHWRKPAAAKTIGFREIAFGLVYAALTAWGVGLILS